VLVFSKTFLSEVDTCYMSNSVYYVDVDNLCRLALLFIFSNII